MANVVDLYRALALEKTLRAWALAEARAELAAKKPPVVPPSARPLNEDEFHGLVRALWSYRASVATIASELGYTPRHIRRVLDQMGLWRSKPTIPGELRAMRRAA